MWKKYAAVGSLVCGLGLATSLIGTPTAFADPGNGNGAVVQHNVYGAVQCGVIDSAGDFWLVDNCVFDAVTTPTGVINETVKGNVDPSTPPPSSAVTGSTATTGEQCDPLTGAWDVTAFTITPSGNFTAKCSSN